MWVSSVPRNITLTGLSSINGSKTSSNTMRNLLETGTCLKKEVSHKLAVGLVSIYPPAYDCSDSFKRLALKTSFIAAFATARFVDNAPFEG